MPDNIAAGKGAKRDALNTVENALDAFQTRKPARQVELGDIPVITILELKPRRVRNIFICSGVVF